jgi:hypothetical protein
MGKRRAKEAAMSLNFEGNGESIEETKGTKGCY